MTPSLPLYPQILPFSLPLPTSLLQPHSLLTVWQHQSHLTSELLPVGTGSYLPHIEKWWKPSRVKSLLCLRHFPEVLCIHIFLQRAFLPSIAFSGEGHGNPLQYSCLRIPWTEELGNLQSMGSQRVRHDCATEQASVPFSSTVFYIPSLPPPPRNSLP